MNNDIKMVKLNHRFRVIFTLSDTPDILYRDKDIANVLQHRLSALTNQITTVKVPPNNFEDLGCLISKPVFVTFDDDVSNDASLAINKIGTLHGTFNMHIDLLDGNNEILDRTVFKNCSINSVKYDNNLSYDVFDDEHSTIAFDPPNVEGVSIPAILSKYLTSFFNNLKITKHLHHKKSRAVVSKTVTITYESRVDLFF